MNITIVGATGAVGQEIIRLMSDFFCSDYSLKLLASEKSVGENIQEHVVEGLREDSFEGSDFVIFCTPAPISRQYVPFALAAGATVIDNSSAFRQDEKVPLLVPEINGYLLDEEPQLIANPNCSTIIALMALAPLHKAFGLKRFFASTYQAVSGAGLEGIQELYGQGKAKVFPQQIAYNVIPQVEAINQKTQYTYEEEKMLHESRKILNLPDLKVSATCVRVPVERSHSVSINAEFNHEINLEDVYTVLKNAPGIILSELPTPLTASYSHLIQVGRIRLDSVFSNGLSLFVSGDQLLKGASLNAMHILKALYTKINAKNY